MRIHPVSTSLPYQEFKGKQAYGNGSLQLGRYPWSIHKNPHVGEETSRDLNLLIFHKKLGEEIGISEAWALLSSHTGRYPVPPSYDPPPLASNTIA